MECGDTYEDALDVELWMAGIKREDFDQIVKVGGLGHGGSPTTKKGAV